jgi:hypothetical protein
VKQFFDSMDLLNGPAGTRWAALFYGPLISLQSGGQLHGKSPSAYDEDLNG